MTLLELKNLKKYFATQKAVDDISLKVEQGQIFGLLGPNGAGKTTLIRMITGIFYPDEGEIIFDGKKFDPIKDVEYIGYMPEERGLYKKMKIGEQTMYLAQLKGLKKADALAKIKQWFIKFEMEGWWNKKVEDLSKGMAQKVQFISTVLHQPKLIILDEPFSGFDPVNAQLITEKILELKEMGSTIIFSTHRMETVESLCDHIALIDKSKKILEGPKKQVKDQYKSNTFIVEHRGNQFTFPVDRYELINQKPMEDGLFSTTLKAKNGINGNQVIRDLIDITEVHSFQEKLPTMSDIFISLVKGDEALKKHLQEQA